MQNKNKLDKLLDFYEESGKRKSNLKKIYYKPSSGRSIFGFFFSFLFLIILFFVFGFQWRFMYLLLLFGDGIILFYYSMNLFTKRGIYLPKYIEEEIKDEDEDI